jgi:medium-chain acyl-[acyl-carrier-protein] hydrolase
MIGFELTRRSSGSWQTYVYSPRLPLDCPITAFGGMDGKELSRKKNEAWRGQTAARFSSKMLPGGHFFAHTARQSLLQTLTRELSGLAIAQ